MNYDRVNAQLKAKLKERIEYLELEIKYLLSVNTQVNTFEGLTVTNDYASGKLSAYRAEIQFLKSLI